MITFPDWSTPESCRVITWFNISCLESPDLPLTTWSGPVSTGLQRVGSPARRGSALTSAWRAPSALWCHHRGTAGAGPTAARAPRWNPTDGRCSWTETNKNTVYKLQLHPWARSGWTTTLNQNFGCGFWPGHSPRSSAVSAAGRVPLACRLGRHEDTNTSPRTDMNPDPDRSTYRPSYCRDTKNNQTTCSLILDHIWGLDQRCPVLILISWKEIYYNVQQDEES